MCSIGGFIAQEPIGAIEAHTLMSALLWYGRERGTQSAGAYYDGTVVKKAADPGDFINDVEFTNLFNSDCRIGLTHTRAPSCGGLGDPQAQPFRLGDTVTIHNGMILNIDEVKKRWKIEKLSGVDSELYTAAIAHYGPKKLHEFMESTEGYSAVAALHDGEMYLMRSNAPTFYCRMFLRGGNCITVFASTETQLIDAISYTWLRPDLLNVQGTQQHTTLHVTATRIEPISRKIRPVTHSMSSYYRYYDMGMDAFEKKDGKKTGAYRYDKDMEFDWEEYEKRENLRDRMKGGFYD